MARGLLRLRYMDNRHRSTDGADGLRGGLRLARVAGIDLVADWSLLLVFGLIALNLGLGALPRWHPDWGILMRWALAFSAAGMFFVSVALHELSHALVGRAQGIPVRRVTLFMFGGVTHLEGEPPSPRAEFLMAVVGPVTSLVLGGLALLGGALLGGSALAARAHDPAAALSAATPLATLLLWLGPVNLALGLFNLVPGFPLDGGRVLRAGLWWATGDVRRATRWATTGGQVFAWLLIASGTAMVFGMTLPVFGRGAFQGVWLVLIGWFLLHAARTSYAQVVVRDALAGVRVGEVMRAQLTTVTPETPVATLVNLLMATDQRAFPVVRGDALLGLVCLEDVRRVPRDYWAMVPVSHVMTPSDRLRLVRPDEESAEALASLARYGVDQLPVVENGHLRGIVRRQDIMKFLAMSSDLAHA